jgi:hypothetical protein
LSIVLIDWSARESFHSLKYLGKQTVGRDWYELIWVEFYSTKKAMYHDADRYVIMGMPKTVCYHKHLMYNVGIFQARGDVVCFCDSDAVYKNTFVASILGQFNQDAHIVLHLDQVRNQRRDLYPFCYPSIEEICAGNTNWRGDSTHGMIEPYDILHTRNYGSCMAALKEDLLKIGGADEHFDYLGYICGPHDMTYRLINAGVREVWHPSEFTYHTWHPNQGGSADHEGPHDGKKMSIRTLDLLNNGRIQPWVKNPCFDDPSAKLIDHNRILQWSL